jgi:cytochrome c peroxidase
MRSHFPLLSLPGPNYHRNFPLAIMMKRWISLALLGACTLHSAEADSVSVNKECFDINEAIPVVFQKDSDANLPSAWIGIFKTSRLSSSGNSPLPAAELWVNLCGTTDCDPDENPSRGTVVFRANRGQEWRQEFPLVSGTYKAVLTRGDDSDTWPLLAASREFRVGCSPTLAPQRTPSRVPQRAPTRAPASAPQRTPTRAPQRTPSVAPRPVPDNMDRVISDARDDIEDLVRRNPFLVGKFLRMAFHDCVGGCDGCIDLSNPDNAGLKMPMDFLQPIVFKYEDEGLSRTDIWMLSAVVASDVSESSAGMDFPFRWIGRKTCEQINNGNCGRNSRGESTRCTPAEGPHRVLCHADTAGTQTINNFMSSQFGFNPQQTAAIMGAHTVGAMRAVNLGFQGLSGWDLTNNELDQGYYVELVDPEGPAWKQVRRSNSGLQGVPARWQFESTVDGLDLVMLNSDIAMVRNLVEGENLMSDGRVSCTFSGNNACDDDTPFLPFMKRYAGSRSLFLADFRDALEEMIENGYARDKVCGDNEVCVLRSRR